MTLSVTHSACAGSEWCAVSWSAGCATRRQPATGVTQQLAAKLKMALATVDASSDKAQLLSKRIAELEVREQEMAVAATSLKEQLTAVHRLKT